MGKREERGKKVSRNKVQRSVRKRNTKTSVQPNHEASAFLDENAASCFVVHRIGPSREYEKLYGPYLDNHKAQRRMLEYVENFVRDNKQWVPKAELRKDKSGVRVEVSGMSAKGEGPAKAHFFFMIKPVYG